MKKIQTAHGCRTVHMHVGLYVETLPRPSAPFGEWWVLNQQLGYVPVNFNSRALLTAIAESKRTNSKAQAMATAALRLGQMARFLRGLAADAPEETEINARRLAKAARCDSLASKCAARAAGFSPDTNVRVFCNNRVA